MTALLITNARLGPTGPVELEVSGGAITRIAAPGSLQVDASVERLDAGGRLLLPTLVDAHCHPDKTTWGEPWTSRPPATTLLDLIENDVRIQKQQTSTVAERAGRLLATYVGTGARAVRAHVDVAPPYGLGNVDGVVAAADSLAGSIEVQIVAFPQLGILRAPGTEALLAEAVTRGATVVGGIDPIGLDGDLEAHLDVVFGIAERHGLPVDLHLHDRGEAGVTQVRAILARTRALGMVEQVTIGHAFCYADCDEPTLLDLAQETAAAGVTLATCALGADPLLPVARLREEGVRVVLGSDGVRDGWSPFGNADMVDRTHLLAWRSGAATDEELAEAFDIAAHAGADLLGLERSTLLVGAPGDFMAVDAANLAQTVVDRPTPAWVVHAGRVVARNGVLTAHPTTAATRAAAPS